MAGTALTPAQLRSHLVEARRRAPDARVIGVQAAGGWAGGDRVECDGQEYAVVLADSPLAVRAALRAAEASALPTVVLTAAGEADLGLDVRARLARRQLLSLDLWEAVRAQFRARDVDPAVTRFAERMIEGTPIDVVAEYYPAFNDHDKTEALAHFAGLPVLVLAGVDDLVTPSEHSEAIADLLPDAELVLVPDAGHLVMLEHPEAVTDRLADLLVRAGAVPAGATVGRYGSSSTARPG